MNLALTLTHVLTLHYQYIYVHICLGEDPVSCISKSNEVEQRWENMKHRPGQ